MNAGRWLRVWGYCALWMLAGPLGIGCAPETPVENLAGNCAGAQNRSASKEVVRAFADPASGSRWLLFRGEEHLGGPGKLVLAVGSGFAREAQSCRSSAMQRQVLDTGQAHKIVIRAGDKIVVRERTSFVDLALDGTALGAAAEGELLHVRLRIGGTVRAIAVLPGLANLAAQREAEP